MKATLAWALPPVAITFVGDPGGPVGVTLVEGFDGAPVPIAFVATTVKVYAVPFVRPVTVWLSDVLPALLSTPPAGFEIAV